MKKLQTLAWLLAVLWSGIGYGQDSTALKNRAFQISFLTPLGSNGLDSWNCKNRFSINILGGYAGGVDGVELSSLGSVIRTDMRGAQFTGLGNIVLCNSWGAQFAGLLNLSLGHAEGAQFGGLANITVGKTKGFQASGLANISCDTMKGCQISGLVNLAKTGKVTQVSGLMNVSYANNKGAQLAGLANINTGRLSGVQVAGLFNYSTRLKGTQIGLFNVVDSIESGTVFGFLSFVRNGYMTVEVASTETMYGMLSFKTGTRSFYTVLSTGWGYRDQMSLFGWGFGVGTLIPVSKHVDIGIEGVCYQINEDEWFTQRVNLLNKLNLTVAWSVAKHFTIFGGPTWNVTVSDVWDQYGDPVTSHIAPYWVFNETTDNGYNVKMYPGAIVGMRF